ncbi:LacI family DNA-binding transcriptional regulator [Actinomyces faecalis]|uniref:LacI family DNA-binding transcriptional regulator n=1 Tax=Actinomyces faecalis TaxID=2722820 RepID=UPI0015573FBA|nr:LacI family DNA-binding transcriptional regulator [Actinomyces faecalis]
MARATRADVAKAAGVSVATVSHVMNGRAKELGFLPATAQRVREAAAAVGYVPRASARSFRYQTSKVIALFFPDLPASLRLPVFNEVLTGAIDAARAQGHFILPVPVGQDPRATVEETLREIELAGAVCRPTPGMEEAGTLLDQAEVPVAWISTGRQALEAPGCAALGINEASGVRQMLTAIDTSQVRHPAVLIGPGEAGDRLPAFLERFPDARVLTAPGWLAGDARQTASTLVSDGADLVFAGNDQLALACCEAVTAHGLTLADDVQVFGFGDIDSGPAQLMGISSIQWPVAELSRRAVQALITGASGTDALTDDGPQEITLQTLAHPRSSTRPAR